MKELHLATHDEAGYLLHRVTHRLTMAAVGLIGPSNEGGGEARKSR